MTLTEYKLLKELARYKELNSQAIEMFKSWQEAFEREFPNSVAYVFPPAEDTYYLDLSRSSAEHLVFTSTYSTPISYLLPLAYVQDPVLFMALHRDREARDEQTRRASRLRAAYAARTQAQETIDRLSDAN